VPPVERGPQTLHRSSSTVSYGAAGVAYKHGSLLSWIREDSRHAFIFALLVLITWIITSHDPTIYIRSTVAPGDANSSVASSPTN
jgi:hypothetical protein